MAKKKKKNTKKNKNKELAQENVVEVIEASEEETIIIDDSFLNALEAMIFISPKPITLKKMKSVVKSIGRHKPEHVEAHLIALKEKFTTLGFTLEKVSKGYQFRSHAAQADYVTKIVEDKPARLSKSALEVLAIVAYRQPITRGDIDHVRGVDSGHLMRGLMEKNLVRTSGHAETPGRPLLYSTTPYFLEVFALSSLDDLPDMDDYEREMVKQASEGFMTDSDSPSQDIVLNQIPMEGLSPLAANPDRGDFDEPETEEIASADFGLEDRAQEEIEKDLANS